MDDVAQEVFLIVHRRLDTFDRSTRFTTWLFGICMRVAANYRRRRRWTLEVPAVDSNDDGPSMVVAADDLLARREERHLAEWALGRLDIEKRATFVMFEVEALSCEEIAKIMNVPVGTVYSRLHAARRQLEKVVARGFGGIDDGADTLAIRSVAARRRPISCCVRCASAAAQSR